MLTVKDIEKLKTIFVTKEEFITRFDAVMFELKAIREEITVLVYQVQRHTDQIDEMQMEIKSMQVEKKAVLADHKAFAFLHEQNGETLENHETRIKWLEYKNR